MGPKIIIEFLLLNKNNQTINNKLSNIIIKLKIIQNISKIAFYLGLTNSITITEFLLSKEFEFYFAKFYQYIIMSQIIAISKAKGFSFKVIQIAIIKCKSYNNAKYLTIVINKTGWQEIDYYAFYLYKLCSINVIMRNRLFLNKSISIIEKKV